LHMFRLGFRLFRGSRNVVVRPSGDKTALFIENHAPIGGNRHSLNPPGGRKG
jgi:hypothetical protein